MFSSFRFATSFKNQGAKAVYIAAAPELVSVFERIEGVDKVILRNQASTVPHDYWVPGFSAGWVAGHDFDNFPSKPYLTPRHDSVEVWQAQILENAEMNLSQRLIFDIKGQKVLDYFPNGIDNEAPEYSEIVTQTSTMSLKQMVEGYKLSWFLITWHTGGFSQYIARFLRKYKNVSYSDFYTGFRNYLQFNDFWRIHENNYRPHRD